jgi:hypothetical protein
MKYLWCIWYILLFIIISILVKVLMFPVNTATKLVDTAYWIQEQTLNADNAIYNYEWFKQKYEDIQATQKQIENSKWQLVQFKAETKNMDMFDKQELSRLNSVLLWLQNHYETLIWDYNARSKMANRNIFVNWLLPSYIDALTFQLKQ